MPGIIEKNVEASECSWVNWLELYGERMLNVVNNDSGKGVTRSM